MTIFRSALLMLIFTLSLGGLLACGNKGPLYIPEPPVEQQTVEPETQAPEAR